MIYYLTFHFLIHRQCRFQTFWLSHIHQPNVFQNLSSQNESRTTNGDGDEKNLTLLYTRGAYVVKLSHTTDLIALACNQKYVEQTCLTFMSPLNGALTKVNLRNFGLNSQARGRYAYFLNF
jgi:hypothetical protein